MYQSIESCLTILGTQTLLYLNAYLAGPGNPRRINLHEHYIFPKESIGLTQEMIDQNITIDQFIQLAGKAQTQLLDFDPSYQKRFLPQGQTTLGDF